MGNAGFQKRLGRGQRTEDRRTWKRKLDGARTRKQRNNARAKYQEACKEVKWLCRRDNREHANNLAAKAETADRQGDLKTLYNISQKLSGRLMSRDGPVRNKEGKLLKSFDEER